MKLLYCSNNKEAPYSEDSTKLHPLLCVTMNKWDITRFDLYECGQNQTTKNIVEECPDHQFPYETYLMNQIMTANAVNWLDYYNIPLTTKQTLIHHNKTKFVS